MVKPKPTNKKLYERIKKRIKKKIPKHSAYRSGLIVKAYKNAGGGYSGKKSKGNLRRWFKERWRNQRGGVGYKKKGDVYRPTRRVSRKTPKTYKQLGRKRVARAMRTKRKYGRVRRF